MAHSETIRFEGGKVYYLGRVANTKAWTTWPVNTIRPMGLGSVELRKSKKVGLHIVRMSRSGHFQWAYPLRKEGYHLLTLNGGVMPKPSSKEQDPFRAILRRMGAPSQALVHHKDAEELEVETFGHWLFRSGGGDFSTCLETDGHKEVVESVPHKEMSVVRVTRATYAMQVRQVRKGDAIRTYLEALHVWPGADVKAVEEAMAEIKFRHSPPLWENDTYPLEGDAEYKIHETIVKIRHIVFNHCGAISIGSDGSKAALWLVAGISLEALKQGQPNPIPPIQEAIADLDEEVARKVFEHLWEEATFETETTFVSVRKQGEGVIVTTRRTYKKRAITSGTRRRRFLDDDQQPDEDEWVVEDQDAVVLRAGALGLGSGVGFSRWGDGYTCTSRKSSGTQLELPTMMKKYVVDRLAKYETRRNKSA